MELTESVDIFVHTEQAARIHSWAIRTFGDAGSRWNYAYITADDAGRRGHRRSGYLFRFYNPEDATLVRLLF